MVAVEQNQPAAIQNANESVKDAPKLSFEISSAESFCSTSQFLTHGGSPDTFVIAKASTQKED